MNFKNVPFNPSKLPFFYGWVIILLGGIGVLMSSPGQTIGFSSFRDYLERDLNMSKVALSTAYTLGTLLSGFMAVKAGKLYDKYGARVVAPAAAFILGLALFYLSVTPTIFSSLHILNNSKINVAFKVGLLLLGFFAIRFCGQGVLTLVSRNMVMKWFDTRRGMANMFIGVMVAVGFSYSPELFQNMIDQFTWPTAWQLIAFVVGGAFVVLAVLFFRDNPADHNLKPDGNFRLNKNKKDNITEQKHFKLGEARKTFSFWSLNLVLTMFAFYLTGFTYFYKDIFSISGHDLDQALSIFFPTAIVAVGVEIVGSLFVDRSKIKFFLTAMAGGLCLSLVGVLFLKLNVNFKYLIIIGNGVATGMFGVVASVSWPRFFGTKYLGEVTGYNMSWMVIGSAMAPTFFSLLYSAFGTFTIAISTCLTLMLVLLFTTFKAENPNIKTI